MEQKLHTLEEESCDLSRGSSEGLKGFSGWHQEPGAHDCNRGEVGEPEARTGTVVSYWLIFSPKYLAWSLEAKHCSGHFISASPLILIAILLVGRFPFSRIREIKRFSQSHTAGGTQSEIWTKTVSPASLCLRLQPHLEHLLRERSLVISAPHLSLDPSSQGQLRAARGSQASLSLTPALSSEKAGCHCLQVLLDHL